MCIRDRAGTSSVVSAVPGFRDPAVLRAAAGHDVDHAANRIAAPPVSYTHLRAHETVLDIVCRLLLEKKKKQQPNKHVTMLHKSRLNNYL